MWVLEALHWETERCRRIMHTCVRANTDRTTYFRICQNFTSAVCAYYYIDTECYNIEANHDKVQTEPVHSPDLNLSSLRSHWPTDLRVSGMSTINLSKQKRWLVKSTSGEGYPARKSLQKRSSAVPLGCHAEINKSALIGQVHDTARYPAGITPRV